MSRFGHASVAVGERPSATVRASRRMAAGAALALALSGLLPGISTAAPLATTHVAAAAPAAPTTNTLRLRVESARQWIPAGIDKGDADPQVPLARRPGRHRRPDALRHQPGCHRHRQLRLRLHARSRIGGDPAYPANCQWPAIHSVKGGTSAEVVAQGDETTLSESDRHRHVELAGQRPQPEPQLHDLGHGRGLRRPRLHRLPHGHVPRRRLQDRRRLVQPAAARQRGDHRQRDRRHAALPAAADHGAHGGLERPPDQRRVRHRRAQPGRLRGPHQRRARPGHHRLVRQPALHHLPARLERPHAVRRRRQAAHRARSADTASATPTASSRSPTWVPTATRPPSPRPTGRPGTRPARSRAGTTGTPGRSRAGTATTPSSSRAPSRSRSPSSASSSSRTATGRGQPVARPDRRVLGKRSRTPRRSAHRAEHRDDHVRGLDQGHGGRASASTRLWSAASRSVARRASTSSRTSSSP